MIVTGDVRTVLERIASTTGRCGAFELSGTSATALKVAKAAGLVGATPVRGWYLTEKGKAALESKGDKHVG